MSWAMGLFAPVIGAPLIVIGIPIFCYPRLDARKARSNRNKEKVTAPINGWCHAYGPRCERAFGEMKHTQSD